MRSFGAEHIEAGGHIGAEHRSCCSECEDMARYKGPRLKVMRRLQTVLPGLGPKVPERRPYPPGEQAKSRRKRISDFGERMNEKQKLRFHYGLTETQFRTVMRRAIRMAGTPGGNLARLLESRLDNVAFRLGFAPSIPSARQLVRHGHVQVNGRRVNIPSFSVGKGEEIRIAPGSHEHILPKHGSKQSPSLTLPGYLKRSSDGLSGEVVDAPRRADIPVDFDERLVVEYYAAR